LSVTGKRKRGAIRKPLSMGPERVENTMNHEAHNRSSEVVRNLRAQREAPAPIDFPSQAPDPVAEQARVRFLRAQGEFLMAQKEGRIPMDAEFRYEDFAESPGAPAPAPSQEPEVSRHRTQGLEPVASILVFGWGITFQLPTRFLDFFRRPFRRMFPT
jgi:hypothetical protein